MKNPGNLKIATLSGDWCDNDIVILHACFQLLTDCVESENLLSGHVNWDYNEEFQNAKNEINTLYNWWIERKNLEQQDRLNDLDKVQYEKDNEMLKRLIDIRQYLWT